MYIYIYIWREHQKQNTTPKITTATEDNQLTTSTEDNQRPTSQPTSNPVWLKKCRNLQNPGEMQQLWYTSFFCFHVVEIWTELSHHKMWRSEEGNSFQGDTHAWQH